MEEYKVENDFIKNLSKQLSSRFGDIAIDKGFVAQPGPVRKADRTSS